MRQWLAAVCVLALLGIAASGSHRAEQAVAPDRPAEAVALQQPTFRTEANYVRVDVYPTDAKGVSVADLTQADFEVLENGVPQKIEQFEHVVVRAAGPQATRIEPNELRESRAMAESSRARLFVIFLDTYHVDLTGSHNIRQPLVEALDKMIGPDDLVAVMTPKMSASDLTFTRRTAHIEEFLTRHWDWGEQHATVHPDAEDRDYESCYAESPAVAAEMIARRHEELTLDALRDLTAVLGGLREERKAILAVTDGWLLYRPNSDLARPLAGRGIPGAPRVGIDPGTGRLTVGDSTTAAAPDQKCEHDRLELAQRDDEREFREMLDRANRANASFYPIDPRGLVVFDTPISAPAPLAIDAARVRQRLETLRSLASATDGVAIVNSNDLAKGLRRVVDDLSSYYLLGYYSSGKLDGRFHAITIRVKRPGVQVRARRGYLAATADAVTAAATPAPAVAAQTETLALQAALAPLAEFQREAPLRVHVATGWRAGANGQPAAAFWVVGEFGAGAPVDPTLDVTVVSPSGSTVGRASGQPTGRSVIVPVAAQTPLEPGEYTVRVRTEGSGIGTVRVRLPASPEAGGAIFLRRGAVTGNREVPTADLRFRRGERIRINLPSTDASSVAARLLDRAGKPLAVPLSATVRDDADGSRWQSIELVLAPLAPADYVVELTRPGEAGGESRTLVAFRVIP